jgi:Rrf2 family transcriptional regulator, iron-sulfur cluster assembly transcription factor
MKKLVKLTTRGRYAVMAMVELGKNGEGKPMPLSEIAKNGDISLSYLEQLIAGLRRQGLVKSYRGPGGGYCLTKPTTDILVSDILIAAEDSTPAKRNAGNDEEKTSHCPHTQDLWSTIGEILFVSLKHISLADVLKNKTRKNDRITKLFEILG